MSYDKTARQIRRYKRYRAIAQQLAIYRLHQLYNTLPADSRRIGRMAKTACMDCGRPRCGLCSNGRKLYGQRTIAEQRSLITFGERE